MNPATHPEQDFITIDGVVIWMPEAGLKWNYETTYSTDSKRVQSGEGHFTELFTVHNYEYKATGIPAAECSKILKLVVGRKFQLHAFCPYYGSWITDTFYVGKGSMTIETIIKDGEKATELSFNMISLNPFQLSGSTFLVTSQPQNATVDDDTESVSFSVGVSGSISSYQWYEDGGSGWQPCTESGATTSTITLTFTGTPTEDERIGNQYKVVATGQDGSVIISNSASLRA